MTMSAYTSTYSERTRKSARYGVVRSDKRQHSGLRGLIVGAGLVTLHFQVATVADAPITLAGALAIYMLAAPGTFVGRASAWAPLFVVNLLAGLTALVTPPSSGFQFLLTALLLNFAVACLVVAREKQFLSLLWLHRACWGALVVVSVYSAAQWILAKAGSNALYNPWGTHQYLHTFATEKQFVDIRAAGFYLEPSFDALVICVLSFFLLQQSQHRIRVLLIAIPGILATQSVSGFASLAAAVLYVVTSGGYPRLGARREGRGLIGLALSAIFIVGIFPSIEYLRQRLSTVSTVGSSANYRLDAPLQVISYVLLHHPFGEPLGSVQQVVGSFALYNGTQIGTSLDNGAYLLIYYFGWVGLALLAWFLANALRRSLLERSFRPLAMWVFVMTCLVNTGGILTPEFVVLAIIFISSFRACPHAEAESPNAAVVNNNGQSQRS